MLNSLSWHVKDNNNIYYRFRDYDLDQEYFDGLVGLYAIYYKTKNDYTQYVYIGQGNIRDRLKAHRLDPTIQMYGQQNQLCITWAKDDSSREIREGKEQYLHDKLFPLSSNPQNVPPIPVNLPPV